MSEGFAHGHALIIGVANYLHVSKLPETVLKDARDVAEVLRSENYCGYLPTNIDLLLDADATKDGIRQGLRRLARAAGSEDTAVVFFSGHGGRVETGPDAGAYVIPFNCEPGRLRDTAICSGELTGLLSDIEAQRLVVLLDACHSAGAGELKAVAPISEIKAGLDEKTYSALAEGAGRVIMSSSRSEEVSLILPGMHNSLFTHFLLDALRGACQNHGDGLVRVFDVFRYISDNVPRRASQHPIFMARGVENNFPLALHFGGKQVTAIPSTVLPNTVAIIRSPVLSGRVKLAIMKQLVTRWHDLATYSEIPLSDQATFEKGREPQRILDWLEQRKRLNELRDAFNFLGWDDLIKELDSPPSVAPPSSHSGAAGLDEPRSASQLVKDPQEFITAEPEVISEFAEMADALRSHRESIAGRIAPLDWWHNPIPLTVRFRGRTDDARVHLRRWCASGTARHAVLIGAPGAGKSGLIWWTASIVAGLADTIALVIPAQKLRTEQQIDLILLFKIAMPFINESLVRPIAQKHRLFILLDGLDELSGVGPGGETTASAIIASVMAVLPAGTRVVASCRTVVFPRMEPLLSSHLPREVEDDDNLYERVLAKTFGTADELEVLEVCPVRREQALLFLGRFFNESPLDAIGSDDRWMQFLTSPILLLLARETLPDMTETGVPALATLFTAYVRHALIRNNRGITERKISEVLTALKSFSNILGPSRNEAHLHIALLSGLLREEDGDYEWAHYTLWEYFFASFLVDEILAFSSQTIAHVDLVSGYNINRLLVPMVNSAIRTTKEGTLLCVKPCDYLGFIETTGWRQATGYGLHPSVSRSKTGVASASFSFDPMQAGAVHVDRRHGLGWSDVACQLSWYDAAIFAHYAGARLATSAEILAAAPEGDLLFWCADWLREDVAHICAYDGNSRAIVGLNPDVRLRRTALAIVN